MEEICLYMNMHVNTNNIKYSVVHNYGCSRNI